MAFGITPTGFVPKLITDVESDVDAGMRSNVAADLDLAPDQPLGQMKSIVADQAAQLWELGATCYAALNPNNAEGVVLDGVCAYTGTKRAAATPSHVVCAMGLNSATTVPAGSMANVAGQPTNTWILRGTGDPTTGQLVAKGGVTSTAAGTYYGYFESTTTGPNVANAGTLTVITNSVTGWNSVTNANDAIRGTNKESDAALQARREAELAAAGATTVDAIRADLLNENLVPGVIQAFVYENNTDSVDATGLPPRSIRAVIYDGVVPQASNAAIAKVLWADKGTGVQTYGATSVVVLDSAGNQRIVTFDRAQIVNCYFVLTTTRDNTFDPVNGPAAVKAAIAAAVAADQNLGVNVIALKIRAAALSVQGVTDVPTFALGTTPSPTGTANIPITGLQIAVTDTTKITVDGV